MNIDLSPENESFVESMLSSNAYPNRDAVIDEALDLMRRRREIISEIEAGIEQHNRGEYRLYRSDEVDKFLSDIKSRGQSR